MILLALDPSIASPGCALFECDRMLASGRLIAAFRVNVGADLSLGRAARVRAAARAVSAAMTVVTRAGRIVDAVVFEWPQAYRGHKSVGPTRDLFSLPAVGCAVAERLNVPDALIFDYLPAEWAGQLPKSKTGSAWKSPRGKRVWSRLDGAERLVAQDQHDAVDAVGLGLYKLGRLSPHRVCSGCAE